MKNLDFDAYKIRLLGLTLALSVSSGIVDLNASIQTIEFKAVQYQKLFVLVSNSNDSETAEEAIHYYTIDDKNGNDIQSYFKLNIDLPIDISQFAKTFSLDIIGTDIQLCCDRQNSYFNTVFGYKKSNLQRFFFTSLSSGNKAGPDSLFC